MASTSMPRRGISALLPIVWTRVPSIELNSMWLPPPPLTSGEEASTPSSMFHDSPSCP